MKRYMFFLFIFSIFIFSIGITDFTVDRTDESYYISSAMYMVKNNEWITPVFENREKRFQKPILFYWLIALSYKLFGINIIASRLPSIFMSSLGILITFWISRFLFDDALSGLYSSIILLSSSLFFLNAQAARTDITYTVFISAAFLFFIKGYFSDKKHPMDYIFASVMLGLSVLTKGPLVLIIYILTVFIVSSYEKKFLSTVKEVFSFKAVATFLVIVLPWHILFYLENGDELIRHTVSSEISERLGNNMLEISKNLFYYSGVILRYFFPWYIFPILDILNPLKDKKDPKRLFLFTWAGTTILFFIVFISSHRARYILPIAPALSVLAGISLSDIKGKAHQHGLYFKSFDFISTIFILFFLSFSLLSYMTNDLGFPGTWILIIAALSSISGSVVIFVSVRKKDLRTSFYAVAAVMTIVVTIFIRIFLPVIKADPMAPLAQYISENSGRDDNITTFGIYSGYRVILSLRLNRFLNRIYEEDQAAAFYRDFAEESTYMADHIVTSLELYDALPEEIKNNYMIKEKSFAYSFKKKPSTGDVLFSDEGFDPGKYRKYFIVLSRKDLP